MAESRFTALRRELLQAGVAPRHARRAVVEIEGHQQQLIDEQTGRGAAEHDARIEAERRLGANRELVRCYAARKELRAWSRRWPWLCFAIVPSLTCLAAGFAALMGILATAKIMAPQLHRMHLTPDITHGIQLAAEVALLWCLPLWMTGAFTLLARRRYVALHWRFVCVVSVSILASLCNVIVMITSDAGQGAVGAGIGVSADSLPERFLHAVALVALSSMTLWALRGDPPHHRQLD